MTVSSTNRKNTYNADSSTTQFAFTFAVQDKSDITVQTRTSAGVFTTKTIDVDYTVSGTGNTSGSTDYTSGTITFATAPATGSKVVITRNTTITQGVNYVEADNFPAETHEDALDKLTMISQELSEEVDRALVLDPTDTTTLGYVSTPAADQYLKRNDDNTGFEWATLSTSSGLGNVVEDTTPQLGGDLDVNGFDITSPDGTDLINIVNGTITVKTNSVSRLDVTDSGVRIGTGARVTTILDEDTMSSNSDTAIPTQQSVKAYVDSLVGAEGVQDIVGAMVTGNTETLITVTYEDSDGTLDFVVNNDLSAYSNTTSGFITSSSTNTLTNKSIDADTNTITNIENADIKAAAAIAVNKLAATTASRALASDASGFITASSVTSTELGYVSGVTSAIQTQLANKQPLDADLTDLASQWTAASATAQASLQFHEDTDNGTNKITLQGPASLAADYTLTFPTDDGSSGQALVGDGNGNLAWASLQTGDATLTALAAYNTNGILTQTASDTFTGRTITGTSSEVTVTNGDGVSGNPTLSLPSSIDLGGKTLEIPNGTAPTTNVTGQIAIDTNGNGTAVTQGVIQFYDGTQNIYVFGTDAYPTTDTHVLTYDSATNKVKWEAQIGGGGSGITAGLAIALKMII